MHRDFSSASASLPANPLLIMMRFEMSDILVEQDGLTYQGIIRFKALTEAA